MYESFEWDEAKNQENQAKHGVSFDDAQLAFIDTKRIIHKDSGHSQIEDRFFCIGLVRDKIITVRFTFRMNRVRIIGAGYWRRGKKYYEQENK